MRGSEAPESLRNLGSLGFTRGSEAPESRRSGAEVECFEDVVECFEDVFECFEDVVECFEDVVEYFEDVVECFEDVVECLEDVVDASAGSEPEALAADLITVSVALERRWRNVPTSLTEESDLGESTERRTDDDSDADEPYGERDTRGGGGGGCLTGRFFGLGGSVEGSVEGSLEGSFWGPIKVSDERAEEDKGDLKGCMEFTSQNLHTRSMWLSSSLVLGGVSGGHSSEGWEETSTSMDGCSGNLLGRLLEVALGSGVGSGAESDSELISSTSSSGRAAGGFSGVSDRGVTADGESDMLQSLGSYSVVS